MKVIQSPHILEFEGHTLFLAGSIEMGAATAWQQEVIDAMATCQGTIFNPRRADWDSSWKQSIENPQFKAQVTWELDAILGANVVAFYFDPATKSPITLAELGLCLGSRRGRFDRMIVCCPEGFYRKGNVDIMCEYWGIKQVPDLEALKAELVRLFS